MYEYDTCIVHEAPALAVVALVRSRSRMRSVTRAAEELCVSPSAVSHQIRKLEEWVGLPLIERNGRGIRLTKAGERYKVKVCEAFNMIHGETNLLHQASPPVRVSCHPMFAVSWLTPQMHDFWERHPDVQVAIQYSRNAKTIDPAAVDIAVFYGNLGQFPDFVAMPLLEVQTIAVASPDYLQLMDYKDLSDLSRLTLLHTLDSGPWRAWLQRAAMDFDLDPGIAETGQVYPDANLVLIECLAGQGAAVLPRSVVLPQLRTKTLVPLSDIGIREDKFYFVLTPASRPVPDGALILAEWMQSLPGTIKLGMPKS